MTSTSSQNLKVALPNEAAHSHPDCRFTRLAGLHEVPKPTRSPWKQPSSSGGHSTRSSAHFSSGERSVISVQMRRKNVLLPNDLLRRGHFLLEELPGREDGWKQRRCSMRAAMVQVAGCRSGRAPKMAGSDSGVNRSAKQRRCLVPVALRAPARGYADRSASIGIPR